MPVKLNHYWTVIPDKNETYKKFIIKEFIPGINKLNLHAVAGWSVLIGSYSEIIFESVSNDLEMLEKALRDDCYKKLKASLLNYVKSYKTKVLVRSGDVDSYSTEFGGDTVKFNQSWDVVIEKKEDYRRFTNQEYYPVLEELGVTIAQEWEVFIGDGPGIICEGRADDVGMLITNLQSKKFQTAKRQLKQYVENYRSRVLSFHIQKVKGCKAASYTIINE